MTRLTADLRKAKTKDTESYEAWTGQHYWVEEIGKEFRLYNDGHPNDTMLVFTK